MKIIFLLITLTFSHFGLTQGWHPKPSCSDSPFLAFKSESQKFGIIDAKGEIIIPALYQAVYFNRSYRDTCAVNDSLAILISEKGSEIINLKTLKKISLQGTVMIIDNYIYDYDSLKLDVYNLNFSQLFSSLHSKPMFLKTSSLEWQIPEFCPDEICFYQSEEWKDGYFWYNDPAFHLNINEDVIGYQIIEKPHTSSNKEIKKYARKRARHPLDYPPDITSGLINLSTRKKTKVIYHKINPGVYNGEIYYWCIRFEKLIYPNYLQPASGYIDVLNSSLKKMNHIQFDQLPSVLNFNLAIEQVFSHYGDTNLLIPVVYKNKFGAFNGSGEEIIQKGKDSINYLRNGLYKVWENNEYKLFNSFGDEVPLGDHSEIKKSENYSSAYTGATLSDSTTVFCQQQDTRVKIGEYGMNQIQNKGHLLKFYIDSIPMILRMYVEGGCSSTMTHSQKQLAYFNLLFDDQMFTDTFYLSSFDSLYPMLLSPCIEFGFYEFVHLFDEINEHRNLNIAQFRCDTSSVIFDKSSDFYDDELYHLRQRLYRLIDNFRFSDIYVDKIRAYIIENKEELVY